MCNDIVDIVDSGITEATMEITATAYGKLNRVDLKDVASEEVDLEFENLFPNTKQTIK